MKKTVLVSIGQVLNEMNRATYKAATQYLRSLPDIEEGRRCIRAVHNAFRAAYFFGPDYATFEQMVVSIANETNIRFIASDVHAASHGLN